VSILTTPLQTQIAPADSSVRVWFALHTLPRQEKALAQALEGRGIEHYLPLRSETRTYAHRRRVSMIPLFSSYVFLRGTRESTFAAVSTKRVARVLDIPDQPSFLREIEQIRLALAGGATLDPYPHLVLGRKARVRSGPLQGVEGILQARPKDCRLILQVQALGQAVAVEIDAHLLEPTD
jgi:transcriptional antiterminator RfaH